MRRRQGDGMVGGGGDGDKRLVLSAVATAILYVLLAAVVTGPSQTPLFLGGYVLAWLLYLNAVRGSSALSPPWVLGWALLARLVWTGSEVWLSDDLYRYLLDGRVLLQGINPFRHAPEHPVIQALVPEFASRVNHPHVPTVYPALVQLAGALAALLRLDAGGWRVLVSLVDVVLVGAISRLFGGGTRGWRAAAVYGLCPLAVIESGANGHVEPLALLPLVLAVSAGGGRWRSGFWLGVAALAKYFPLILLPYWAARSPRWRAPLSACVVVAAGMLPFAWGGVDIGAGLRSYLEHWSFNGPVFASLSRVFGESSWLRALPFAVAGAASWVAGRRGLAPPRAVAAVLFLFLLCGPTLHPWYALWLLPFLGPRPSPLLWSFVFAMGLSYAVWWQQHVTGEWALRPWQSFGLWGIVLLGGLWPRVLSPRRAASPPPPGARTR